MIQGIVIPCLTLFIITANCLPANEIGERQMSGSGNRNCVCMNWRFCGDGKINSERTVPRQLRERLLHPIYGKGWSLPRDMKRVVI
nr:unnamed protein product [Callosobruchus chinensis]